MTKREKEKISVVDVWGKQISFWRSHLDIYVQDRFKVKLTQDQQVIFRAASGSATDIKIVQNRGAGKSWEIAWIAIAIATLYSNCPIAVVSATAQQATIVLRKIQSFVDVYPELLQEIRIVGRDPVVIAKDKGRVWFKNGSKIESYSNASIVGERAKVIIVDEAYRIDETTYKKNVTPCANFTRDICIQNGFEDFESKIISITSAPLKSSWFYADFVKTVQAMGTGDKNAFACALDWKASVRAGITKKSFFEDRKKELPEAIFDSEYGSIFLGEEANSVFPYDLTEQVRTLKHVEYEMPKGSKCWYVISFDIATSEAKGADNAVITVIKCVEQDDGSIIKQVVYIRTYHGHDLNDLANELRKTYVRFPNVNMIVFDHRGLGDSLPQFLSVPWIDPDSGKEYPAWSLYNGSSKSTHGLPILYSFKANNYLNQELVTALRVSLEQKRIALPVSARDVSTDEEVGARALRMEERAIYLEADALQVEMGNIVMKMSSAGQALYDTAKSTQHKDRFSSLAMGVWYISKIEEENKRKIRRSNAGGTAIVVSSFSDKGW